MQVLPLVILSCAALVSASALESASETGGICKDGYYYSPNTGCELCPRGYYCIYDEKHLCPNNSGTSDWGNSACAVKAGYYWLFDHASGTGSVQLCERDHYCEGGFKEMAKCPTGTRCGRGCRVAQQCT